MESNVRMDERNTLAGSPRPRFAQLSVPASPDRSAPIDRAHLARYTLGDATLEREIWRSSWPNSADVGKPSIRSQRARMACGRPHPQRVRPGGRAWAVASLAEEAERLTEFSNGGAVHTLLQRIERAIEEVEAWTAAECGMATPACA